MTKLEIVDSGKAQFTKREKLLYRLETGLAPSNDQDKITYNPEKGYFAVADGVGGMPNGTEAAQAACEAFDGELSTGDYDTLTSERALYIAQVGLSRIIHTAVAETDGFTTFTGMYRVDETHIAYLHAGDSGLFRRRDGAVQRITSIQHKVGNVLTHCMGAYSAQGATELPMTSREPSMSATEWGLLRIQAGDRFILATDGVTDATASFNPDADWWAQQTDLSIGAQSLAHHLVRVSPRLDDSAAIVVDYAAR